MSSCNRLLILEDDQADLELMERELSNFGLNFESRVVSSKREFSTALVDFKPDVVIADCHVPGFDWLEALETAERLSSGMPFILLSGVVGEGVAVEAVKSRVTDYVLKDRLARLPYVVQRAFNESSERRQLAVAEQAVAQGEQEIRERSRLSALSGAVGVSLNGAYELSSMLQGCADAVVEQLEAAATRIWTVDSRQDVLVCQAITPAKNHVDYTYLRTSFGEGIVGRIAAERKAHIINEAEAAEQVTQCELVQGGGIAAFAGFPLMVDDCLVGVMEVFCRKALTDTTVQALTSLGAYIALGIRRKNTEQELLERSKQQEALAEFGRRVLAASCLSAVMDEAVLILARVLGVDYAKVLQLEPGGKTLLLVAGVGWMEGLVGKARVNSKRESQAGYTLACSHPVVVEDLSAEKRFNGPKLLHDHGIVSGVSVIIGEAGSPFGVLGAHTGHRRHFSHDDVYFVQSLANILAAAVERQQADDIMRRAVEAEQRITRQMVEHAPVGIVRLSADLNVIEVNEAFCQCAQMDRELLDGKQFFTALPGLPEQEARDVLTTGQARRVSGYSFCRDVLQSRRQSYWDITFWPIKENGDIGGLVVQVLDISEKVKLTQQRELFVQTMSHDLKAPLFGADRALEALLEGKLGALSSEQAELLAAMKNSNQNALRMVKNLLEISRYREGSQVLVLSPILLPAFISDCARQMDMLARGRGVMVNVDVPPDVAPVLADPIALQHLFMNLLENAVKFSTPGSSVDILASNTGSSVKVSVRDSGPGIPAADQEKLFTRFWQGDLGKSARSGSGLGLYLCHRIVLAHGGKIECRSSPGQGTIFEVTLSSLKGVEKVFSELSETCLGTTGERLSGSMSVTGSAKPRQTDSKGEPASKSSDAGLETTWLN